MNQAYAAGKIAREILNKQNWTGVSVQVTTHKRTYFMPDGRNTGAGKLVFGGKMIHTYTSGTACEHAILELTKAGYYAPYPFQWCPAAAAVLIVLHELAHVAVHRAGLRVRGSMHGGPFYDALRDLIGVYMATMTARFAVLAEEPVLLGKFRSERLHAPRLQAALVEAYPYVNPFFSGDFRKEDLIVFDMHGVKKIGRLIRRGKKRWTVKVDEDTGIKYYIPESMMRLCGKSG